MTVLLVATPITITDNVGSFRENILKLLYGIMKFIYAENFGGAGH